MSTHASSRRPPRASFRCSDCGYQAIKWTGRCPECQAWGTLAEAGAPSVTLRRVTPTAPRSPALRLRDVDAAAVHPRASGIPELDRVLGGGLTPGGVTLLAGEPGVGKSTLLLAAAQAWAAAGHGRALIVTGEETAAQVRLRADRVGATHPELYLAAETDLGAVLGHLDEVAPSLLVIDSVQTIADGGIDSAAGGVTQVRAVASALTVAAKEREIACVLVGHVTKDGSVAGPRVLEHLVDVVLHFEGDRHSALRLVRGVKNRFGPADEVGCFAMTDAGIESLSDPTGLFLSAQRPGVPGTCTVITMQGRRPLPVEIQTLVSAAGDGGHRTVSGLDSARVSMVLAIVQQWASLRLAGRDVLAATVGGARVTEPAADLALAMAVWSSARDIPLPHSTVVLGELGLSGEIRPVVAVEQRLAEAARLGFRSAIVPDTLDGRGPSGLHIEPVPDLTSALRALGNIPTNAPVATG